MKKGYILLEVRIWGKEISLMGEVCLRMEVSLFFEWRVGIWFGGRGEGWLGSLGENRC